MSKPTAWVEVIDPETGRKVDVRVSFHADWSQAGEPRGLTVAHVNRLQSAVITALAERGSFTLSDLGEAE